MKTFWQHRSGKLYAIQHDAFGHIVGVAGPLDGEDVQDSDGYTYNRDRVLWAESEIKRHAMHRMQPALAQ